MHSPPAVTITGANGFIGSGLCKHFKSRGWKVTAFVHHMPALKVHGIEYVRYEMQSVPPEGALAGADALVHCAYLDARFHHSAMEVNLRAFRCLVELSRKHEAKVVLLSSFSAHDRAESEYGRIKLAQEALCDPSRDLVLRPALVIGRGGLAGRILEMVQRQRFLPIPGAGRPVQIVGLGDLCRIVEAGLERNVSGIFRIAHPEARTMKHLFAALVGSTRHKRLFLPVPVTPLLLLVRLAESAGLRLPVTSENLLGLRRVQVFDTRRDLAAFGVEVAGLEEAVKEMTDGDVE